MPHLPANAANQSSATRHLHQVSQTRCTRDQINRSLIGLFMTLITLHHHHQGRDVPDIKQGGHCATYCQVHQTNPFSPNDLFLFFKKCLYQTDPCQCKRFASVTEPELSISIALEPEAPAFYTSYWHLALNFQCVCEVQLCHRGLFAEDWIEVSCAPETSAATGTWNRFLSQRKTFLSSALH